MLDVQSVGRQTAVTAHVLNKQLLLFAFPQQCCPEVIYMLLSHVKYITKSYFTIIQKKKLFYQMPISSIIIYNESFQISFKQNRTYL